MPGLGKGLDALIPTGSGFVSQQQEIGGVSEVPVSEIVPNPRQPRVLFKPEELAELADSIREHGIIQPLIVTRNENGAGYILIAGERRLQASKQAGLKNVPVVVRHATDQQRLELALIENIQRADLNALEEAHAYQTLSEEFGLLHEKIAAQVGKNRVTITNTLRLLKLPAAAQQALVDNKISEGHARALLGLETATAIEAAMRTVIKQELTVRQTEELVRNLSGLRSPAKPKPPPPPDVSALEQKLQSSLGTRVSLRAGKKGNGALTLYYYSNEDLDALLSRLLNE